MEKGKTVKKHESTYDLLLKLTQKTEAGILLKARNYEEVHFILFEWIKEAERLKEENDKLREEREIFFK